MWPRVREILVKELRQALRDPRMRTLLFIPPLVQLMVFGYAVNLDLDTSPMAWVDGDHTPESRALLAAFVGSGRFVVRATPATGAEIERLLERGEVQSVVRVAPGFARDLQRGETAAVQILIEGTNSNTAAILSGYASNIVADFGAGLLRERAGPPPAGIPSVEARSRVWFNPELKSRYYFVPGVIVNIIAIITMMLTAMSIVREKELGTMEQLMVTPIRPVELMLGKMLPFALVGLVEVALITTAALLLFRIPFRGSALVLLLASVLFLMTTLGVGLFLSTISNTQQQAMMASFVFMFPAFMLSGFAFPIRNMPASIQLVTYLNPLRYFMEIVRGLFLKGTGIGVVWPQLAALLVIGVAVLGISSVRFRKRLE